MTSYKWAVSFPDSLCVRVVLLLILYIVCESDALGIPQISDVARLRPNIFYTIARQHDSLEFLCDRRRKTVLWILPNNQIVNVNQTSNHNETIEFQESTLIISKVSYNLYSKTLYTLNNNLKFMQNNPYIKKSLQSNQLDLVAMTKIEAQLIKLRNIINELFSTH
jgi:hypothetical protein